MSLRINTNVQAMGALRNLTGTVNMLGNSMTKLSTGLRINSAADDPAGLIISEGMRSQLKGLDQAIRNSQDAVNMAKTAEGALDEVQRLLRDMRAITVHSANAAVVDSSQLQANQSQIRSLVQSIDRIAGSTAWGTKKLLDGTTGVTSSITNADLAASLYVGSTFGGYTVQSGNVTLAQTTAATSANINTGTIYTAATTTIATAGTFVLNGYAFKSDGTETVQSMVNKVNALSSQTGVVASTYVNGAGVSVRLTQTTPGAQFGINLNDPDGILHTTASTNVSGVNGVYNVTATTTNGATTVAFTGGRGPGDSGLKLTDTNGNILLLTAAGNQNWPGGTQTVGTITSGAVQFQIGANANQSTTFAMPTTWAANLGTGAVAGQSIATMDVTSTSGANNAMAIVDAAITQLAAMRGSLGSFQSNFLESTVRSLGVAQENLTAAESQIRDADMATEMTRYTQLQILQQSGISMLAQANQAPQSILSLLQSR